MSQQIFFAHANGFPSGTYGKLFAALAPEYKLPAQTHCIRGVIAQLIERL